MGYFRFFYCLLLSCLISLTAQASTAYYPLAQRISSENGLSQNVVRVMEEDQYGRLWVGTQDGLNLLNNNEFIIFRSDQDEYRISGTTIADLALDPRGGLWVASEAGLDYVDTTTLESHFVPLNKGTHAIAQLLLYQNGSLFYLASHNLYRYNIATATVDKIDLPAPFLQINILAAFDDQHILVLSDQGLGLINITNGNIEALSPNIPAGPIKAIHVTTKRMWLSIQDTGLFSCNLQGQACTAFTKENHRLPTNNLAKLTQSGQRLYLATDKGIGILDLLTDELQWIYPHSQNKAYQASQIARDIIPTSTGDLFVGTFNGLYRVPYTFSALQAFNTGIGGYPEGQISLKAINLDGQQRLAIAEPEQVSLWTLNNGQLRPYKHFTYPKGYEPTTLQVDDGLIYLSSLTAGNLMLDPQTGQYQTLESRFPQLGEVQIAHMDQPEPDIRVFHMRKVMKVYRRINGQWLFEWQKVFSNDSATAAYWQHRLYVANYQDGLTSAAMTPDWREPTQWQQHFGLGIVINLFLHSDKLFVLTANLGLFEVHSSSPVNITKVPISDNFGSQTVVCAVGDNDGKMVLAGHKGLIILNKFTLIQASLTSLQGTHEQEFAQYDCGTLNGSPFFGGAGGLTLIHNSQQLSNYTPNVKWTHLEADQTQMSLLNSDINRLTSPSLIRLHFIVTPSDLPKQATYHYRIQSLSEKWIEVKSSFISLTNLRPGTYQVELEARDFAGKTGPIAMTTIEILPPFWESPIAIMGYIALGLLLIAILVANKHRAAQQRLALEIEKNLHQLDYSRRLEQEVQTRTQELAQKKQEAEEANIAKTRFIAAASHDLKHPLNLIKLQLKQQGESSLGKKLANSLGFLEQLVSSIVELSRLDAKVLVPQLQSLDLSAFLTRVIEEHRQLLQYHNIGCEFSIEDSLWVESDALLLRRIVDNILNNAIKISEAGTQISIHAYGCDNFAHIKICDQGPGMTPQTLADLFKPFTRWTNRYEGSGLGLSVVKGVSDLLNIDIQTESELEKGTCFTLRLTRVKAPEIVTLTPTALRVAIVEDDSEQLQQLSRELLSRGIMVLGYRDADALIADQEHMFDAIISDIDLGMEQDGLSYLTDYRHRLNDQKSLIIYMSGNPEILHRVPVQPQLFFFTKPVKLGKLMWLLNPMQRG